jgi:type IV pilus assembly protein PilP
MANRSPFAKPMAIKEISRLVGPVSSVKPNEDRAREYLESFAVESLSLVGHIQKGGVMYALVNDGQGSVHPVTVGNYLGRNHGKIVGLTETEINVTEIVPGGGDSWVERPRTISLQE